MGRPSFLKVFVPFNLSTDSTRKLFPIEDRVHTNRVSNLDPTLTNDLDLQSQESYMIMTTHMQEVKVKSYSVQKLKWKWTEAIV